MKCFVGNGLLQDLRSEWWRATVLLVLTLVAAGVTQTGVGGIYLFAIGFMTIALLIDRRRESASKVVRSSRSRTQRAKRAPHVSE